MNRRYLSILTIGAALLIGGCAAPDPGTGAPAAGAPAVDYRNSHAEVVVLNFFDMYCPHCHAEAPRVNKLHGLVQARGLGSRIEFFGIGLGNSPMEAETYRTRFKVPYAVVSDRDRAIASRFGKIRPPLLLALRKEGGTWVEFYRIREVRGNQEAILNAIKP